MVVALLTVELHVPAQPIERVEPGLITRTDVEFLT